MIRNVLSSTFKIAALAGVFATAVSATAAETARKPASSAQTVTSTFPKPMEVEQEGLAPHVGITGGISNPEGSYKSGTEFGANFGFQPYIPFGLGVSLTFSKNQAKDGNTRDLDRTAVLARGTYNFGGNVTLIKNSFIGVATGPIMNQDATYFALAPLVGFDIPVREWSGKYLSYITVGAEARYMIVSSNESDGLTVNGAIKYWF